MNFSRDGEIKGKLMKVGDLHYSLCEHRFRNRDSQKLRVLLFDFKEARIMYDQATRDWVNYAAIKNDSIVRGPGAMLAAMLPASGCTQGLSVAMALAMETQPSSHATTQQAGSTLHT